MDEPESPPQDSAQEPLNDPQCHPTSEAVEENVTLITESMLVTSSDEEKLQLLNRNTELRRINKELMRLNEEWDHIYRHTTAGLQQRVSSLEQEANSVRKLISRLLIKVEHEQSKREYCEQTLLQELKKNQRLQEYACLLEKRLQHGNTDYEVHPTSEAFLRIPTGSSSRHIDSQREMQTLKEQLQALRFQTQVYESDYKTEQEDRKRMQQENKKLRRKEMEMRQQMALLHEQLKVYEDDFRQERSDKQVLQRLLMKKGPSSEPILIHRCNNDHEPLATDRGAIQGRSKGKGSSAHCQSDAKHDECRGHKQHKHVQTFTQEYN